LSWSLCLELSEEEKVLLISSLMEPRDGSPENLFSHISRF